MAQDLTFKDACDLIKKDQPELLDKVDKLLSLALICTPAVVGAPVGALLPVIGIKSEVIKIEKAVLGAFSKKSDADYVAKQERMQAAYCLLCFTAFFEALDRQLSQDLRKQINLLSPERMYLAREASEASVHPVELGDETMARLPDDIAALPLAFPHPTESLADQVERNRDLWASMTRGFEGFVQQLAFWEAADAKTRTKLLAGLKGVPKTAASCFEAQYFDLARRFEDFAIWANLQEHKKTKELIGSLSTYVQQVAALSRADKSSADIGFTKLHDAVLSIPKTLEIRQATELCESLRRFYEGRINDFVIEEAEETAAVKLSFPRVRDAFIPQSYQVVRHTPAMRFEDSATWQERPRRNDLGSFLLNYLSSPYSTEAPLLILGHPGSGKSLLTTVLSAQLMSSHYTVIRVPLREVNAEAEIFEQIEDRLKEITHSNLDPWAKLSGNFENSPPIVILDGYDELLQASGKVHSNYLKKVQNFQRNEAEQDRPVRVIVTSRITLIDKATIPLGATVLRLLDFDERQQALWVNIWNRANVNYFRDTRVEPFSLPDPSEKSAARILALASQPLLLLMLAIFDSHENKLRKNEGIDRTRLYESLLSRFVARERRKDDEFEELSRENKQSALDEDMIRLGVAAVGMFNRRSLYVSSAQLNADLAYFGHGRPVSPSAGTSLSQGELLLGSFFFVHKSKAQVRVEGGIADESYAFEFLHNTFGEFLAADFILRQAVAQVEQLKAENENPVLRPQYEQHLAAADGLSNSWFASLVFTPLFTRPVVLEMMREWIVHVLKRRGIPSQVFLQYLESIVNSQLERILGKREMPAIMRGETGDERARAPFGDYPLLGHIAIYSLNLVLLRLIVSADAFVFDEDNFATHEDGARPWDRLTQIWRAWFAMDNLSGITAVMAAERNGARVRIRALDSFQVAESKSRLETFRAIASSVGDNLVGGLTGLMLHDPSKHSISQLDNLESQLLGEGIHLDREVLSKRLAHLERNISFDSAAEFGRCSMALLGTIPDDAGDLEIEFVALRLRNAVEQLMSLDREEAGKLFGSVIHPDAAAELAERSPRSGQIFYRLGAALGDFEWTYRFGRQFLDAAFSPRLLMSMMERTPEFAFSLVQLAREIGTDRFARPFGARYGRGYFIEELSLGFHADLARRNPDAFLIWLQLLQDLGEFRLFGRFPPEVLNLVMRPGSTVDLTIRSPESFLAWLRLTREFGPRASASGLPEDFLRVLHPRFMLDLSARSPSAALAWLQLIREASASGATVPLEILEQGLLPGYLFELTTRSPEVALAWLETARSLGGGPLIQKSARQLLDSDVPGSPFAWGLRERPAELAVTLFLLRAARQGRVTKRMHEPVVQSLRGSPGREPILPRLSLSSVDDLRWFAQQSADPELAHDIESLVAQAQA